MSYKRTIYLKESLKFEIKSLNSYLKETEDNLVLKQNNLRNEYRQYLAELDDSDEEYRLHLIDDYIEEDSKYSKDFPSFFYESSFLILFSFFEANLARTCRYLRNDIIAHNPKIEIVKPTKTYIQDSKMYLENICKLKLKAKETKWNKLDKLREFRNLIAHCNMDLRQTKNTYDKLKKKEAISYINRVFSKPISIDQYERCTIINHKILIDMLSLIQEYLFFIIDKGIKTGK